MLYSEFNYLCLYGASLLLNTFRDEGNDISVEETRRLDDEMTDDEMQQVLKAFSARSRSKFCHH